MRVIIAGAGDIGFHLAKLMAFEKLDIVLIDRDPEILERVRSGLDLITVEGDASNLQVLREAGADKARLVVAVTTSEQTNLLTAILAKKMGARQTIARVRSVAYLDKEPRAQLESLGVDTLISPQLFAAQEIRRLIRRCSLSDIFEFEGGKIALIGIVVDEHSPIINMTVRAVDVLYDQIIFKPIALLRGHQTIIARDDHLLVKGDHIYFLAKSQDIETLSDIIGKKKHEVRNVMILGGTELAAKTAVLLEKEYRVTVVDKDRNRCKNLVSRLSDALVVCADPGNLKELEQEGLVNMDAVVALTENSEANIIASLLAEEAGVYKTIAHVANTDYIRLSQNIGVDTLINEKLIAANNIFRFVRKGKVEAITSLHGSDAEVIEFHLDRGHRTTKHRLNELHIHRASVIGGIVRGDEVIIPNSDFRLEENDKVIVFALPEAIGAVEKLFR